MPGVISEDVLRRARTMFDDLHPRPVPKACKYLSASCVHSLAASAQAAPANTGKGTTSSGKGTSNVTNASKAPSLKGGSQNAGQKRQANWSSDWAGDNKKAHFHCSLAICTLWLPYARQRSSASTAMDGAISLHSASSQPKQTEQEPEMAICCNSLLKPLTTVWGCPRRNCQIWRAGSSWLASCCSCCFCLQANLSRGALIATLQTRLARDRASD